MSTTKFLWKVTRLDMVILAFLAAWFMASLSQSTARPRLYAALVAALGCLGSSIYHYGAAHRVYARKEERVDIRAPWILISIGSSLLFASIAVSLLLPLSCMAISVFNALAVALYARLLSRHWTTKNFTIAIVITTPVILGWLAGTTTPPVTGPITALVFFSFLGREVIKDVLDIKANHGIRVTLPMVMGTYGAMIVAAAAIAIGGIASILLIKFQVWGAAWSAGALLGIAFASLANPRPSELNLIRHGITVCMAVIMLSFI